MAALYVRSRIYETSICLASGNLENSKSEDLASLQFLTGHG